MSAISRTAPLLAGLRHLHVKAEEPGCWLLTLPRIRNHAQAAAERDALLARLRGAFRGAVWGIPHETKDEINWCTSIDDGFVEFYGDWALLLFAQTISEFAPPPQLRLGIKCQDLQEALRLSGADVIIVSLPDDIEWMVAERA
jgi:hypothetical protein